MLTRAGLARAVVTALLAAALSACAKSEPPAAFERPPAPVRVAAAVARDVPVYLDEIGRAVAKETVWARAEVAGRVAEAKFDDGADLKKGDLLFRIDPRIYEADLAAAEADLGRARANLVRAKTSTARPQATLERARAARDLAQADFARAKSLIESKAISQADFDAKKSDVDMREAEVRQAEADLSTSEPETAVADADVKRAEAAVARARLDVEYCEIRAPIDGRAGHRLVDAGNLVSAMGDPLVMLERLDPVYVDFTVPESELSAVQTNRARGVLKVEVRLPDAAGEPRAGELTFVDNAVQETTGTLKLRATVRNEDHLFWPGQFVKVRLVLETLPGAALVPAVAEQQSPTGPFVYVVGADDKAEMRPVKVGQRHGDLLVVRDGVRAGERVIVEGQLGVAPGAKVRVVPDAPPAPTAPEAGK